MQPERFGPDDSREWINRARSNLTQARTRAQGVYLEDLCYLAQQAAEKAIKGLLLAVNQDFPYTHDLSRLLSLFEGTNIQVPDRIKESVTLSQFAYVTRYPGSVEPVTESEYDEALELASDVVAWADTLISRGMSGDPNR